MEARVQALAGLAVVGITAVVALWLARPPAPKPVDAPTGEFSAQRAMVHVEELARAAHPMGSNSHRRARAYVVNELRRLGWQVEVQESWSRKWRGPLLRYARVQNLLARPRGARDGRLVLLSSHYDSVPSGPGAADASAPVAAILESLRALRGSAVAPNLRVLITDGEEAGLLGAQAFAENHPQAPEVALVLNFEARGNRGVPWMFETGEGAMNLVRLYAHRVPHPFANSLSTAIYRRMPNDTDYTVFRRRGVQGLNIAMIGNHSAYHSQLDTPSGLSRRSLQGIGEAVLGMARGIGGDWSRSSLVATYFNPLGSWLVIYPVQVDQAVLVVGVFLAGIWLWGRVAGLPSGFAFALGAWGSVPVVVGVSWLLLVWLFPGVVDTPNSVPYVQAPLIGGWFLLGFAAMSQFAGWMRSSEDQPIAVALVLLALLGAASVKAMPEATYMLSWPLLALSVAAWIALRDPLRRWLWLTLAALPVPLLYAPLAREALRALTPNGAWMVAAMVATGSLALLPLLAQLGSWPVRHRSTAAAMGLGLVLATGLVSTPGPDRPRPLRLAYVATPRGESVWVNRTEELDPWLEQQTGAGWLTSEWNQRELDDIGDLGLGRASVPGRRSWVASARNSDLPGPLIRHLQTGTDEDGRWVDVQFTLRRGGEQLWLSFSGAVIEKVQWLGEETAPLADGEVRQLVLLAPRRSETLRFWARGLTPIWITAYELTYGLPRMVAIPEELLPSSSWTDFSVRVGTRAAVDDRAIVRRAN